jgi:uncharacterized damage-inducible protein DinB
VHDVGRGDHHRGQIALALKQTGHRLPERVAMQGALRTTAIYFELFTLAGRDHL